MVTYADLFQFVIMLCAVITLVVLICKKSRKPLKLLGLRLFLFRETPGNRTPDNLIKSQVLYHLS